MFMDSRFFAISSLLPYVNDNEKQSIDTDAKLEKDWLNPFNTPDFHATQPFDSNKEVKMKMTVRIFLTFP